MYRCTLLHCKAVNLVLWQCEFTWRIIILGVLCTPHQIIGGAWAPPAPTLLRLCAVYSVRLESQEWHRRTNNWWQYSASIRHIAASRTCKLRFYMVLLPTEYFSVLSSGNRTPGSRFYFDHLDTFVCLHQLVLKAQGCSYNNNNCKRLTYGSF